MQSQLTRVLRTEFHKKMAATLPAFSKTKTAFGGIIYRKRDDTSGRYIFLFLYPSPKYDRFTVEFAASAFHITRVHPATDEPRTISLEEWLAYVNSDGEMSLKGHSRVSSPKGEVIEWDAPGLAEWTDPLTGKKAYFDLTRSGRISVSSPSQATLVKMFKVAKSLGAVVRGDANEYYDASGETTQHPHYASLFTTTDKYVRARHRCFVAECFLNSSATEWVICIRPTSENARPLDRYACKYFRLSQKEAEEVCVAKAVGSKLMEKIDGGLHLLGDSVMPG